MPTDYERICRDNIEEYGKGTRHLAFLGRLYSDKTHFLYELLQNAEDARASKVSFVLGPNGLVFKHDGKELFNEEHIRGICGVAEGTKAEDETKIGKFGIGFKSVYAYTRTPEIHCAEEHFLIQHFVRPTAVAPIPVPPPWTTLFTFPFAQEAGIDFKQAHADIKFRLASLGVRTLLFLPNLREIAWEVEGVAKGIYQAHSESLTNHRTVHLHKQAEVLGQPPIAPVDEDWILFQRQDSLQGNMGPFRVEAAFLLAQEANSPKKSIQRLTDAPLVVYFPTAIQTGLGFLVQGPYRTTPARDNIEENHPLNTELLQQTGELIVEALRTIKNLGMLTVEVLNALPLKQTLENAQRSIIYGFRQEASREERLFAPIASRVAKALKEEEFLPAHTSGYVSGNSAVLAGSAQLRDLLSPDQLQSLLGSLTRRRWIAAGISASQSALLRAYLIATIGVQEITAEVFTINLTPDFLRLQSDDWFIRFYSFLGRHINLFLDSPPPNPPVNALRYEKEIIRLQDDTLVPAFRKDRHPNAFLPPGEQTEYPTVKKPIVADPAAKEFLVKLGLSLPDKVDEVIEKVLPKYSRAGTIQPEENLRDVKRIADAATTDSKSKRDRLFVILQNTAFLACRNAATNEIKFAQANNIHFDTQEHRIYFSGNPKAHFLFEGYDNGLHNFLAELGVATTVRCFFRSPSYNGHVSIRNHHSNHVRGLDGFDPGFEVEGLEYALSNPTLERSKFVWNRILIPHAAKIKGIVEYSSRQDFSWSRKDPEQSTAGKITTSKTWLPDRAGKWNSPKSLACANLPDGFTPSEVLCRQLEIDFVSVNQLAEKAGIPLTDLETLRALIASDSKTWEQIKQSFSTNGGVPSKPKFPHRAVQNPDRRDEKIRDRTTSSPGKSYTRSDRSVRDSKPDLNPQTWLATQYTNEDNQVICQMCECEMPFKKRDGNYYFEAVEAFDHLPAEHYEIFLALCPVCAAKYKEFVKHDEANTVALKTSFTTATGTVIPVQIGQEQRTMRFVETHAFDLRIILDPTASSEPFQSTP